MLYSTGPKRWMDAKTMFMSLCKRRSMREIAKQRHQSVLIDNYSGKNMNDGILYAAEENSTNTRYFEANTTEMVQLCDLFVGANARVGRDGTNINLDLFAITHGHKRAVCPILVKHFF